MSCKISPYRNTYVEFMLCRDLSCGNDVLPFLRHTDAEWRNGKAPISTKTKCWLTNEKLKNWLMPVSEDTTKAFCKYCKWAISARIADIEKYITNLQHVNSNEAFNPRRQRKINVIDASKNIDRKKIAEPSLAMDSATHSNMNR